MIRTVLRDIRFWLTGTALLLALAAIFVPRVQLVRPVLDVVAVFDITGSMNTRDMNIEGRAGSRLEAAQAAVRGILTSLPCGSRLGVGVFTERSSFLLFEPAEVCANYAALDGSVRQLDWRMAWAADSHVSRGLYKALEIAGSTDANLAFFTDGHEAPPLPASGGPVFDGDPGAVRGLIVGVGGRDKTPIPKFDFDGREIGTWGREDVPHENRVGLPPKDASSRPGYHPRNAPWGGAATAGDEHLSSVREAYLDKLAEQTGLGYANLAEARDLVSSLQAASRSRSVKAAVDIRPYPAGAALILLLLISAVLPALDCVRRWRQRDLTPRVSI